MDLELITIGTELLLGFTVDTNGAEIARALAAHGVRVVRRTSVGDTAGEIREAVTEALRRTGAVLTTGGLGPTRDDITKRTIAELFDVPLRFDAEAWAALVERFHRLGRVPSENNRSQAEVPDGAVALPNRWGTAPGIWLEHASGLVIMLPGVPSEMRNLLAHEVVPRLVQRQSRIGQQGQGAIRSAVVRTTGIPESSLAERLGDIESVLAPLTLAYLPGVLGVDLRLTAWQLASEDADRRLRDGVARVRALAGDFVYGDDDADLAAVVLGRLRAAGLRLGVAESCTGGLVGGRITAIPGSSDTFLGGVIAYDDRVKAALLDVPSGLLREHGAVSRQVAGAMAIGAANRLGVDVVMSVTGIAGPGGATGTKPVGLVCFGSYLGGVVETSEAILPGTRHEVQARAAQTALFLLYRRLLSLEHKPRDGVARD